MGKETKVKKKKRGATVLLGERDEDGKLLTPHTKHGLFSNMVYILKKLWQYKKILVLLMVLGTNTALSTG